MMTKQDTLREVRALRDALKQYNKSLDKLIAQSTEKKAA